MSARSSAPVDPTERAPNTGGPNAGGPDAGGPDAGGPDAGGPDAGGPETDGAGDRPGRLPHVAAIDGLRGVAVAAIVVYHFWPAALPGGFIGVDVFMVLSGFLLSSLLIQTVADTHGARSGAFLVARVRRLWPALLLTLLAIAVFAIAAMSELEQARVRHHTLAALAYVANWRFVADGTTYTDAVAGASPLRHLWSLGIEEQFYVALAIVVAAVVAVTRRDVRRLRICLGAGAAAMMLMSAAWMAYLHAHGATVARTYFGTDTRAQALLAGVVLGAWSVGRAPRGNSAVHAGRAGIVGAAALVILAATARESAGWMHTWGFLLVACAAGAVIAGLQVNAVGGLLRHRWLVALGVISYGVYLWHWPILVLATPERVGVSGWPLRVGQLAATLAIATLSYRLVERPIRQGALGRALGRPALVVGPIAVLAVALVVIVGPRVTEAPTPSEAVAAPKFDRPGDGPDVVDPDLALPRRVVILGDSVAHTIAGGKVGEFPSFERWTPEQSTFDPAWVRLHSIAKPACSFLPGKYVMNQPDGSIAAESLAPFCEDWRADLRREVAGGTDDLVVVLANDRADRLIDGKLVRVGTAEHDALLTAFLDELRVTAETGGTRLVVVALPPSPKEGENTDGWREKHLASVFSGYAAAHPGTLAIDLGPVVCPSGRCRDWRYDGLHFTTGGAQEVARTITAEITR